MEEATAYADRAYYKYGPTDRRWLSEHYFTSEK